MTQTYKIQVSMNQAHIVESGFVWKQGDFGFNVEIEVLDFDATGSTPQIIFRKSNGAVEATTITVSGNKYTYTLRGTELDTPGPGICDLKLKNSTTQRISTASFKFFVIPDTEDGLNQQASSYSDTIEQMLVPVEDDIEELQDKFANTENIFDKTALEVGSVNSAGGINTDATAYRHTDYLNVEASKTYWFNAQTAIYAFYNSSKTFIANSYNYWSGVTGGQSFTSPQGAAYLRICYNINQDNAEKLMLYEYDGTILPYVKHGSYIPNYIPKPEQLLHAYQPYASGNIYFTIPINSYVPKRGTSASAFVDNEVMSDVPAVLRLPASYYHYGKATPLIMVFHGAGYGVSSNAWGTSTDEYENSNTSFETLINTFVNAGYAVCDINSYNATFAQQHWGAPRAIYAYRKLYEYVTQNYNLQKQVCVYGFSMGGLGALNFANSFKDIVKVVCLGAPVTALYNQCWHSQYGAEKGWRLASATAYDFDVSMVDEWTTDETPSENEQACWDANQYLKFGFDPMEGLINSRNLKRFPPIRIWIGTADPAISLDDTNAFVGSVQNSGGAISIRAVNGGTHSISFGSNTYVNTEIVRWFDRYVAK